MGLHRATYPASYPSSSDSRHSREFREFREFSPLRHNQGHNSPPAPIGRRGARARGCKMNGEPMTVGSLFAGIGGIELGLEWTGRFRTVWQVEKDEYCQRVLARHWPSAARFSDVCAVGAHDLAPVDLICGGFPCQDISNAGKREGITGARSGLWSHFARIVRELRPRYVLVENVAALLGRGLGVVLGDLAACGYDAEWSVLSAQNVGAPHLRERLFVLADSNADESRSQGRRRALLRQRASQRASWAMGASVADTSLLLGNGSSHHAIGGTESSLAVSEPRNRDCHDGDGRHWWLPEPDVGRVAHGVPARVDRLRALGNAVVPQCAERVGRLILAREVALCRGAA